MHESHCSELLVKGGKRSGKSVSVSAEFASRVLGVPLIGLDGKPIKRSWPAATPDYPRIYWIIGWDTKHIGQTIYRLLFARGQGGSFRVIRDLKTGLMRSYNRADPSDAARVKESELAEPLIPERYLDGGYNEAFEWEDKKARQFNSVRLTNGAMIYAFPSSARNPKQGDAVSGIWVDEDIQFPGHLTEWQDRLTDEEGWFMWSVWPHMKNEALLDLNTRAELAEFEDDPQIKSFQFIMTENPFLSQKGKDQSLGRMDSEEQIARRNRGELLTDALSMYSFSDSANQIRRPMGGIDRFFKKPRLHEILTDMYLQMGHFPRTWTRYLSVDPSNTRTACHSWVIPPWEVEGEVAGNLAIVEWELVVRRYSARQLADALSQGGYMGSLNYEAFVMDQQAGRQTHAGREEATFEVYSNAFREKRLESRVTGNGFFPGCNVPSTRYRAVRDMLEIKQDTGMPMLLMVEEKCPETKKEFGKYRKKTEDRGEGVDSVLDMPAKPRLFDCMASIEYGAAYLDPLFLMGQAWVDPKMYSSGSSSYKRAKEILAKQQDEDGVVYMGGESYNRT